MSNVSDERMRAPHGAVACLEELDVLSGSVLELGCGDGAISHFLARRGYDVLGVDLDRDAIAAARRRCEQLWSTARFRATSLDELDRLGRRFGTVIDAGLFHHLAGEARRVYARALADLLMPDGFAFLLLPRDGRGEPVDHRAARAELRETFDAGWTLPRVDKIQFEGVPGERPRPGWLATLALAADRRGAHLFTQPVLESRQPVVDREQASSGAFKHTSDEVTGAGG